MIIMAMTRNRNLLNIVMTLVNMSFWGVRVGKSWDFVWEGSSGLLSKTHCWMAPCRQNNTSLNLDIFKDFLAGTKKFAELCPLERPEPDEERTRTSTGGEDGRPAQWEFTACGESWPSSQVYLQKGEFLNDFQ